MMFLLNLSIFWIIISFSFLLPSMAKMLLVIWLILLWKLLSTSSHVLLILLTLEVLMLTTVLIFSMVNLSFSSNSELLMTFFTLAVCEASLGLGLLIQLSRKTGSELLSQLYLF